MAERAADDGKQRRGVLARLRPIEPARSAAWENLVRTIKATSPKADLRLIERAYEYAASSHADQFRASGEPFIEHPLGVCDILAELGMDTTTLVSALLHDVVEDTPLSLADIESEFGAEVAQIIDGLTKLDKISFHSREQAQAENLRKMIIAMARDIRVLLIKLADRLHNMRTIGHLPREKQDEKARETLDVFAPLAHRLGIGQIKWQLEDLSFATLHPKRFEEIVRMVEERAPERDSFIASVLGELDEAFKEARVKAEVSGRPKHYWSIYEKMIGRGKEFGEIFDLIGIRVLVDSVRDSYAAVGVMHALWKPVPGRFKDYIAMPKFNMYQSLHTTVVGPEGKPLEIQIRSHAMHRTAEYGIAAHWKYKAGAKSDPAEADLAWLRQMLDWQREMSDPREFMESLRIDLYQDEVFVFTPKGDVLAFPRGSTPIDFAYAVHTEVGHRCIGAKVNGRLVPLDYKLESGDAVEVVTSKAQTAAPHRDWLKLVRTTRARNKIRQWFSRERREDAIEKGREDLVRALRKARMAIKDVMSSDALRGLASELKFPSLEAMEASIGEGHLSAQHVVQRLQHELGDDHGPAEAPPSQRPVRLRLPSETGVVVPGVDDILVRLARCCTPVPGDNIIGFITRGRGISVHRADCPNSKELQAGGERIVEVGWDSSIAAGFTVSIQVEALDRQKLLRDVTTAISDLGVNIMSTSSNTNPRTRVASLRFTMELGDPAHLDHILSAVKRVDGVYDAFRVIPGRAKAGGKK
jgi:GTP diphosphokinase / guanosine-3',5'-bis(diphosphate) 3'-diphosphatase